MVEARAQVMGGGSVRDGSTKVERPEDVAPRLIGELLGLLAHDLRNPLSALHSNLGYLDAVLAARDEEVREAIEDGLVSCDGLSHVIDNVDLFGQALRGAGDAPAHIGASPVAGLIAAAVESCQAAARSHGLVLQLDNSARQIHASVESGRELATRALSNLIRNSIQHAPPASTVTVSVLADGPNVRVQVRDCGVPFPDSSRKSAFTAEGQVAAKARSGRYSRGMGLYCAELAAALCGATIQVLPSNEAGDGNVFELVLRRTRQP
jgi:signal transduction histidine kinase